MQKEHGIIEDIAAEIGYTAANSLVDWFGGANLYVPNEATEDHPICKIIGMPAFRRLVKMFDGMSGRERTVWLNQGYQREIDRRDRMIAVLYELNLGTKRIASITGMSERHVQHTRLRVEQLGILPMIRKSAGLDGESVGEMPGSKNSRESSQKNPGGKAVVAARDAVGRKSRRYPW